MLSPLTILSTETLLTLLLSAFNTAAPASEEVNTLNIRLLETSLKNTGSRSFSSVNELDTLIGTSVRIPPMLIGIAVSFVKVEGSTTVFVANSYPSGYIREFVLKLRTVTSEGPIAPHVVDEPVISVEFFVIYNVGIVIPDAALWLNA